MFPLVAATIATLGVWALATPGPAVARLGGTAPAALRAALRDGRIWAGTWFTMLPATLLGVLDVLVPLRLNALGAGALVIGGVFLVSALLEAGASPIFGRLTDRYGWPPLIRVGLVAAAAFAVLLPLPNTDMAARGHRRTGRGGGRDRVGSGELAAQRDGRRAQAAPELCVRPVGVRVGRRHHVGFGGRGAAGAGDVGCGAVRGGCGDVCGDLVWGRGTNSIIEGG